MGPSGIFLKLFHAYCDLLELRAKWLSFWEETTQAVFALLHSQIKLL